MGGADPHLRAPFNNWTARDFAVQAGQLSALELLDRFSSEASVIGDMRGVQRTINEIKDLDNETDKKELSEEDRRKLDAYHKTFNDEKVDLELILHIVK